MRQTAVNSHKQRIAGVAAATLSHAVAFGRDVGPWIDDDDDGDDDANSTITRPVDIL